MAVEFCAPLEKREFDKKCYLVDLCTELFDKTCYGAYRAAGSQQIVEYDDPVGGGKTIFVQFDGVGAVFEIVRCFEGLVRQFAFFANRDEPYTERICQRAAEYEPAGFRCNDGGNTLIAVPLEEHVDGFLEFRAVLQQSRDIFKIDAGFREIRYASNGLFQIAHKFIPLSSCQVLVAGWLSPPVPDSSLLPTFLSRIRPDAVQRTL